MSTPFAADIFLVATGGPQIRSGAVAPTAGAGVVAPLGSMYFQTGTVNWWKKTGAGNTAWSLSTALVQTFVYVAGGGDGSDFPVSLPVAEADDAYAVFGVLVDPTNLYALSFPNALAGDRTTTQFRVVTTGSVSAGDTIQFWITR